MSKIEFDDKRTNKLVLLADDSSTVRKLVTNVLDQAGFEYDCFEDGEDLIAFLRKYADRVKPDVIILDVEMPKMNGFDACQLIKQTFPDLKAPVLFFTSSDTDDSEKQAREVGGDEFIIKPFEPAKLVALLDHWVSKTTGWDASEVAHDANRHEKRVMFADDSRTVRKMVTMVLEKAGFTVDGYESGIGLISALDEKAQPKVIILDVEMPELDGFGTCEKIRKDFPDLTAPIIFFTSHNTDENNTLAELVGGNGFSSKSLPPAELVMQVEKWSKIEVGENRESSG